MLVIKTIKKKVESELISSITKSSKMEIELTLNCFDDAKYTENIIISKHILDKVPYLNKDNVELMVFGIL